MVAAASTTTATADDPAVLQVTATPAALELIERMTTKHGPVMFHQSGGCCDGSSPMCYPDGDFITSEADVHLGDLPVDGLPAPVPFWMSVSQYAYWRTRT